MGPSCQYSSGEESRSGTGILATATLQESRVVVWRKTATHHVVRAQQKKERRVEGKGCKHGVQLGPGIGGGVREIEGEASDAGGGCDGREGIVRHGERVDMDMKDRKQYSKQRERSWLVHSRVSIWLSCNDSSRILEEERRQKGLGWMESDDIFGRAGVREWQEDVEFRGFGVQFHTVNCGQAEELSKGTKGVGNWSRPRGVVLDRYVVERWIMGCHKSWPTLQLGVLLRYIDECEVDGCVKYLSEEMMLRGERPDLGDQRAGLQIRPRFYKMYKALGRQFRDEKRIQLSHVTKGLVPELTEIATL
ncbi:hypothetical protein B0H14DRAFT_2583956 [Mycena olivaceomarginata]|nr:hypothetical protein B0H14DRAFT_2583956 [Mycena olivaceomarginata]